ncbi:MAG TPA: hypothetical protein VFA70_03850, partial [Dehalococcoidia bacterium]|nr:hypothetical protein [Dehalococcoidia bacterium]
MSGQIAAGEFFLGCVLLTATLALTGAAAALLVRRRLDHLVGSARVAGFGLLWVAGVIAAHLAPLLLGVLTRGTVVAAGVLWLGAAWAVSSRRAVRGEDLPEDTPAGVVWRHATGLTGWPAISWALAAAGVVLTAGWALSFLHAHASMHPESNDALAFHLPGVIRFIQTGSLWRTTQYLPNQAQGNYPQFGDLLLLAAVLPWHSAALVRYVDPLLLALGALCVYAIGRELRASAPSAALAACAFVAMRATLDPAFGSMLTDPTFLAGFGAGVLFLVRHWRTHRRSDLVLAGLGLGIALGTKWYGLTDLPALLVCWGAAWLLSGRSWARLWRSGALLIVVIVAAGGVWLVRNLVLTGNPVFNYKVSIFGVTIFNAPPDFVRKEVGFALSHYLGHPGIMRRYVWPVFRSDFGLAGGLFVGGALIAGSLSLLRDRMRGTQLLVPMLAAAVVLLIVAYLVTPYTALGTNGAPILVTANTRYAAPAMLVAAPLTAWLMQALPRLQLPLQAAMLVAVVLGLHGQGPFGAAGLFAAAILLGAAVLAYRLAPRLRPRLAVWVAGACAVAACAAFGLAYHYERLLARTRYIPDDPAIQYVLDHAPAHTRIALAGTWTPAGLIPVAPLFGPRFANHVDYIGPFVAHVRRQYTRAAPFISAVTSGRYAFLVI